MVVRLIQQVQPHANVLPKEDTMTTPTATAPYLVTVARDHSLKLHRSTCKKATANAAATPTDDFTVTLNGKTATPATCCKPKASKPTTDPAPIVDAVVFCGARHSSDAGPVDCSLPDGHDGDHRSSHKHDPIVWPQTTATYDPHPGRRADLAVAEGKAKRAAKKAGLPIPPTPNLDKVTAEYESGIDNVRRRQMVAEYEATNATGKGKRVAKVDVRVRFVRNGKPMPDSQNKLASVAYYHTKDVEPGKPRCTTDALRQILAAAGVPDPESTPWGPVTLSNGVVLEAVAL